MRMIEISASPCLSPSLKTSPSSTSVILFNGKSLGSSNLNVKTLRGVQRATRIRCSSRPGPGSGESESKAILDAFFLGKALAEAVNERIGSTVGEFLSVIGQWQAEQQKQVLDFQEDVLERARKAKEKAAREAKEEQGVAPYAITSSADTATPVSPPSSGPTNGDYEAELTED